MHCHWTFDNTTHELHKALKLTVAYKVRIKNTTAVSTLAVVQYMN